MVFKTFILGFNILSSFLSLVNNVEGGYRNSQRPPVRLFYRKVLLQPQFFTDSYLIFTACLYHWKLKNFIICSVMKIWHKLLPWQPFFFLSFNTYLLMSVLNIKATFSLCTFLHSPFSIIKIWAITTKLFHTFISNLGVHIRIYTENILLVIHKTIEVLETVWL